MKLLLIIMIVATGCSADKGVATTPDSGNDDVGREDVEFHDTSDSGESDSNRRVLVADESNVYVGWYTHNYDGERTSFQDVLGSPPPVVFTFHDWNVAGENAGVQLQTFSAPLEGSESLSVLEGARDVAESGGILAVAWDSVGYVAENESYWNGTYEIGVSFRDILGGVYDEHIRASAREIKSLDVPIMLSPFGEIDSASSFMFGPNELTPWDVVDNTRTHYGDPELPDGAERVRDAYRYIVDIFREEEVTNVTWFIYTATGYMARGDKNDREWELIDEVHPRHFYPGDDYVDWVGTSIYLEVEGNTLSSQLDRGIEAWRSVTDRPFFAPEFGLITTNGSERGALIEEVRQQLPASGISLFGFADSELYELIFDIPRLENNPNESTAFRELVSDPAFSTTLKFETRL